MQKFLEVKKYRKRMKENSEMKEEEDEEHSGYKKKKSIGNGIWRRAERFLAKNVKYEYQ